MSTRDDPADALDERVRTLLREDGPDAAIAHLRAAADDPDLGARALERMGRPDQRLERPTRRRHFEIPQQVGHDLSIGAHDLAEHVAIELVPERRQLRQDRIVENLPRIPHDRSPNERAPKAWGSQRARHAVS